MIDGNFEDKYNSTNPVSRFLVSGFIRSFGELLDESGNPNRIVELGAGEGHVTKIIIDRFPKSKIWASDISKRMANLAEKNLKGKSVRVGVENIEKLSYPSRAFDLCVCCEVLEHVGKPEVALREIRRIAKNLAIVSVPSEPIWRILNMARLKYLRDFGNTPGHVNHWSRSSFERLIIESGFKIVENRNPFPWQMYLIKKT